MATETNNRLTEAQRNDLINEALQVVLNRNQAVPMSWLVQEIWTRHPELTEAQAEQVVVDVCQRLEPKSPRMPTPDELATMTPEERAAKADEMRAFGEQCDAHAAELEQYLEARKKDRARDN